MSAFHTRKRRTSLEEMEEDIKNFDLGQPFLFCRTPSPPPSAFTREQSRKISGLFSGQVSIRSSTSAKSGEDRRLEKKKSFNRPASSVGTAKNEISAQKTGDHFYSQLLEYFIFLFVKLQSLTENCPTGANTTGGNTPDKYQELGRKIVSRTQDLLNHMVCLAFSQSYGK